MKILEGLDLVDFDLYPSDYTIDQENKEIVITKKNWDYLKSLELQEILVERIWKNKDEQISRMKADFENSPKSLQL